MNELITPELSQLPALPTSEVKAGVDKIGGYIGMLTAAKKATADQTIIDEVDEQIRKYSALRLRWQMELGRRTAEIPKASGGDRRSEDFQNASHRQFETRVDKLKELGVDHRRASENERMASEPEAVERYIERSIEQGEAPTTAGALKAVKAARKKDRREAKEEAKKFSVPKELPDTCELFVADIESGIERVPKNSVDFIITDPPYPKEYIYLYECLSDLAADVLKDGGSLLVMCGQSYLPEVIEKLCTSMTYHWTLCYLTPGGQSPSLWQKNTNTFWKPIIWMTKGKYKGDYIGDVIKTDVNSNDKRFHEWGQSENGMASIIEKFTYPGDVIMDPFLGGGTTGVCAVSMGRRFIGCDISEECVNKSRERIINSLNGSQE